MTHIINSATNASNSLQGFAALVMADDPLAEALNCIEEPACFVEAALRSASAYRIALDADALRAALQPDPLGLARWSAPSARGTSWPSRAWLPVQVATLYGEAFVDWVYFGARRLTEPFFEDSIRNALRRPFSRLFRYRMTLRDFLDNADATESLQPSGFMFHMSRCGSTLVAQMLAASPHSIVMSEAAPIDAVVQASRHSPHLSSDRRGRMLAAMIAAFGRRRIGDDRHYIIKLDSWHTLALPLFARTFPSVPWVFFYRDPVEVLVSQLRQRGTQMVPEIVPPGLYGIDLPDVIPNADYCARVLDKVCRAVVDHINAGAGGAQLVNYSELPDAVLAKILPYFGIELDVSEREAMRFAALRDAKAPAFAFSDDSAAKQREATDAVRILAHRHIGEVYRELEALRQRL